MIIRRSDISIYNGKITDTHDKSMGQLVSRIGNSRAEDIVERLKAFQVAIPSWALGAGGTRFGRFAIGGEPSSLEEKLEDIGILHALTGSASEVSLHIPWDTPQDPEGLKQKAQNLGLSFSSVNSNTFQDAPGNQSSYKYGSLDNLDNDVRNQAVVHNHKVIEIGKQLQAKSLTVWLADGANFPGQKDFKASLTNTQKSLQEIYANLPPDWKLLIEYKPFEPNFYSTVIPDWGTSLLLAEACGSNAFTLVDLGHHLPNTNIEQIVATLLYRQKLGGFHFNDSKYGDDDLTVGSIKPYALYLIFLELVKGLGNDHQGNTLEWMIDASHNTKDPLEDLLQSLDSLMITYAKALLLDKEALKAAQTKSDTVLCQQLLQDAFLTDIRPLVSEARKQEGGALNPIAAYRELNVRSQLIKERGFNSRATGL